MLPSKHRLPLRTELHQVKEKGVLIQGRLFSLILTHQGGKIRQASRFGFIISTKVHKKAVKRNRAKRLLGEAIQELLPKMKSDFNVVFLAKKRLIEAPPATIKIELKKLFTQAGIID